MKKSRLGEGLEAAARIDAPGARRGRSQASPATVLIGAHFPPEVRRVLFLIQAEQVNQGKNLKQLLGEAINDLCVKYHKPQPYTGEA
jgi:hypothetical protein